MTHEHKHTEVGVDECLAKAERIGSGADANPAGDERRDHARFAYERDIPVIWLGEFNKSGDIATLQASDIGVGGIRLLGVVASKFAQPSEQLTLEGFDSDSDVPEQWTEASAAVDRVRGRFGSGAIGPASSLAPGGLRIVRRGQQQWGTNDPSDAETARSDRSPD